jgi:thiamine biosynthesis lipoprotein
MMRFIAMIWTHYTRQRALLLMLAASWLMPGCAPELPVQHRDSRPLMGTVVSLTIEGETPAALAQAADAAYREMGRLSDMMNHYSPDSVVSEINRQAGVRPVSVPLELMDVLQSAQRMSARTNGAFDITVGSLRGWRFDPAQPRIPTRAQIAAMLPRVGYRHLVLDATAGTAYLTRPGTRIDLGGIAKLYILNAGLQTLQRHEIANAMINGGGDVVVAGHIDGRPWRVGIRDARQPERLYAVIERERGFVVSSGDYERYFTKNGRRYHHILDPRTGYPTVGPHGVTLVGEDIEAINGLSAAIMVLGAEAGRTLIEATPGIEGVIFERDGSVWVSPGLAQRLHDRAGEINRNNQP